MYEHILECAYCCPSCLLKIYLELKQAAHGDRSDYLLREEVTGPWACTPLRLRGCSWRHRREPCAGRLWRVLSWWQPADHVLTNIARTGAEMSFNYRGREAIPLALSLWTSPPAPSLLLGLTSSLVSGSSPGTRAATGNECPEGSSGMGAIFEVCEAELGDRLKLCNFITSA